MDVTEFKKDVETALKAFNEVKTLAETLKVEQGSIKEKMDAFDQATFNSCVESVGKAVDGLESLKAAQAASEAKTKELEAAFARAPKGTPTEKADEIKAKRNQLFNQFVKQKNNPNKQYFDEFVELSVSDEAERKSLSVGSDPDGGYTVLPESGGIIQEKVFESSPIRQLASQVTIGADQWEVVTDNDEASSGWVGETQSRTETATPQLGKIIIPVHELYAEPRLTQKIVDDSVVDIEAWLTGKVAEKFGREEATAFVTGDGSNKPRGFLTYAAGTGDKQIQQVNSASASTFTYAGFVRLQSALKEAYQANATFLINRASIGEVMLIVDGQSRPIFNGMFDKNVGLEPTIMGRPVRFANDMPAVVNAALAAAYGDFRSAYTIVDRAGVRLLRDPYTAKPFIKLYTTKRVGGDVVNFEALKLQVISNS